MILFRPMSAQASLSSPTPAPTGAMADCATPSTLLLLFIIRLLIAWAEGVAASLRERTETTDLTEPRARLRHHRHRAHPATLHPRPAAPPCAGGGGPPRPPRSRRRPAARIQHRCRIRAQPVRVPTTRPHAGGRPYPPGPRAHAAHRHSGPRHRSTPPPTQPEPTATGPVHPLTPRGMAGPVVPIPPPPAVPLTIPKPSPCQPSPPRLGEHLQQARIKPAPCAGAAFA